MPSFHSARESPFARYSAGALVIDDVNQGSALDNYSPEVDYVVADLGKITFAEAGERTFRFLVTGQNPDSQGYQFVLDYIDLVR